MRSFLYVLVFALVVCCIGAAKTSKAPKGGPDHSHKNVTKSPGGMKGAKKTAKKNGAKMMGRRAGEDSGTWVKVPHANRTAWIRI